ncbi:WD40 repeat-containing protein [Rivularia sp. PCC 7116]|uniref:serine/threonine-protein kinase n=1 Tax=Rivularia sp. PCC 7116 TaxID=373994 RepID=UPI00029EDA11|nr:serine/threonine-protein kinase [Rivularia sp. PCC 7116]AFY56261.1 WD40 repeat-containing protein [Rivularia sp. PCC 7116]
MSYCFNPRCENPQNSTQDKFCLTCGTNLLLKERYRSIKIIGQGSFGRTLLTVDESKSEEYFCVIKQFLPQAQGTNNIQKAAELFEQEAERLDKLGRHNQIPKLLDYLIQEEHQYLVQEYIDGHDLAKVLKEKGKFKEQQIWELLNSLLPVLEYIHTQDVIHRDIKPQNIILGKDGKLYLVDFGAAKVVTGTAILQTGTSIGTPEFVAPEQSMGKATYSSDLYSLGVTCIHLLTEISPFDLFDISEYNWVWKQYLVNNPVRDELAHILDKLIETATSRRYQLANQVLKDVKTKFLNNEITDNFADYPNWKEFYKLKFNIEDVTATAISNDGMIFATAGYYYEKMQSFKTGHKKIHCLQLRRLNTNEILLDINSENWVNAVAISPDNKIFAIGDRDNNIKLWDINSGEQIYLLNAWHGAINDVSFSPDGKFLASGGDDTTIKLWDISNGSEIRTLKGHNKSVKSIVIAPRGDTLASIYSDGRAVLWDLTTGRIVHTLDNTNTPDGISSVAFSPDGKTIAIANRKKYNIKLWDIASNRKICNLTHNDSSAINLTFNLDGKIIASRDKYGHIRLWDINKKQEICTLYGNNSKVNSLIFSSEGQNQILLTSGCDKNILKFRDFNQSYVYNTQDFYYQCITDFNSHTSSIDSIAISPDGKNLASSSHDNTIKLWNISTGKELRSIDTKYSIYAIAFSPDGLTIASGDSKNNIYIWDINSGEKIRILEGHTGRFAGVNSLKFSPDGQILASAGGDKTVKLWNLNTGAEIMTLKGHERWVSSVAFSPDGKIFASGSADETANFWDLTTGEILETFKHNDEIRSIAFSPNGEIFATGSNDNTIKLWSVSNKEEVCTLKGHKRSIRYITFSPNGEILATSSYGNDIKLWDMNTKQAIFSLEGYLGKVNSIVWSADGKTLFSGSDDKTIKVWQCEEMK